MKFCPFSFLMIFTLGVAALPLHAQDEIIYSKPADAKAGKVDSKPDDTKQLNAEDFNAPSQVFNSFSPNLPMPRPLYFSNPDPSVQDALNKRKNWTLLTPEQIFGIQTPEEILGVAGNTKDNKDLSLEEQFLLREKHTATFAATNGSALSSSWNFNSRRSPFDRSDEINPSFSRQPGDYQQPATPRKFSQFFNVPEASSALQDKKAESPWTSAFAQPDRPKVDPEQVAARERFRALMEQSQPQNTTPTQTRYSFTPDSSPSSSSSSFFQKQPQFNPAGRSVAALEDNTTRPTGIQPLPGITGPSLKVETKKPAWQAQLPPWMREGPQSH